LLASFEKFGKLRLLSFILALCKTGLTQNGHFGQRICVTIMLINCFPGLSGLYAEKTSPIVIDISRDGCKMSITYYSTQSFQLKVLSGFKNTTETVSSLISTAYT